MRDPGRARDVSALTSRELERTRRELQAALALAMPGSPAQVPILAHMAAIDAELAGRGRSATLTPAQSANVRAPVPGPGYGSPARIAATMAALLARHGLTRIYTTPPPRNEVSSAMRTRPGARDGCREVSG